MSDMDRQYLSKASSDDLPPLVAAWYYWFSVLNEIAFYIFEYIYAVTWINPV